MRGARAKHLRRAAIRAAADSGLSGDRLARLRRRLYRDLKRQRSRSPVHEPPPPRRAMAEKQDSAVSRGASERAERKMLLDGDDWLAGQPWMSIQRLRRVARMRRVAGVGNG